MLRVFPQVHSRDSAFCSFWEFFTFVVHEVMADIITISSDSDSTPSPSAKLKTPEEDVVLLNKDDLVTSKTKSESEDDSPSIVILENKLDKMPSSEQSKENLFVKFISQCEPLLDGHRELSPSKIMQSLKREHESTTEMFKRSQEYTDMLMRAIKKVSNGRKDIYVVVNDIYTLLKQHQIKRKATENDEAISKDLKPKQPKRVRLTKVFPAKRKPVEQLEDKQKNERDNEIKEKEDQQKEKPSTSKNDDTAGTKTTTNLDKRIERLEELLQRISDEIKRLQAHELTMEEMDEEDSMYIQEDKLKKRFMKVYERICHLKKVSVKNGRLIETKILVGATRYPELNNKVEKYINKAKFPDFYAIQYLVKKASNQSNLNLKPTEIRKLSEDLFKEVGEKLKKRRHYDFVYNFGSYLTDNKTKDDPAKENPELQEKLQENQNVSETAINNVIEKFVQKQAELDSANAQTSTKNSSNEEASKESDQGSEPPSDESESDEEEQEEESDDETDIEQDDLLYLDKT
uniref:Death domain-associated protein 6 n=1 Tax=Phallusia mammillata TaxID=59560 RepID=A0A6F9DB34_9ASCI|nr:death domain-associated protein 6-like [Phallusia mammillata]